MELAFGTALGWYDGLVELLRELDNDNCVMYVIHVPMYELRRHLSFLQTIRISNFIKPTNFILGTNIQQHKVYLIIKVNVTLIDDQGHR